MFDSNPVDRLCTARGPETTAVDRLRRRLLMAGAALPAACAAPNRNAIAPQPMPPPLVRVGDRWRYEEINRYSGTIQGDVLHEVVAVSPQLVTRLTDRRREQPREERFAAPWYVLREQSYDLPIEFAQPMPLLPPSADIPGTLTSVTSYRTPASQGDYAWRQDMRVRGWERVTVPAGTFDCVRIDRSIWFVYPSVFRRNSSRYDTIWYAPAVNRWVQREWGGEYIDQGYSGFGRGWNPYVRDDWVMWRLVDHTTAAVAR